MSKNSLINLLFCLAVAGHYHGHSHAQQIFTPWSFSSTQGDFQVSLSLWEPMTGSYAGNGMIASMGFHQGRADMNPHVDITNTVFHFDLFPNPTYDKVWIKAETAIYSVFIYDIHGRIVDQHHLLNTSSVRINLDLSPGIYFSKVLLESGLFSTQKIIVL